MWLSLIDLWCGPASDILSSITFLLETCSVEKPKKSLAIETTARFRKETKQVQTCQTVRPGAGGLASEKTAIPGRSAMPFLSGNEQPKPKGSHFDALTGQHGIHSGGRQVETPASGPRLSGAHLSGVTQILRRTLTQRIRFPQSRTPKTRNFPIRGGR
jgi:hypothetical protein